MSLGRLKLVAKQEYHLELIHIGNTDLDSAGCLLVGDSQTQNITKNGFIGSSTDAYKRVYPQIADVLVNGGEVCITYVDYD